MPSIKAFGYRWLLASDDLIFIGLLDNIVYFPWAIWCCFKIYDWFQLEGKHFCENGFIQDIAFFSFCGSMIVQWLLAIGQIYFSMQGTMCKRSENRLPLEILFRIKTIVIVLGLLWLPLAGYVFHEDCFYDISMKQTLMIATAFQSIVSATQVTAWLIIFDNKWNSGKGRTKKKTESVGFFLRPDVLSTAQKWKFWILTLVILSFPSSKSMRSAVRSIRDIFIYVPAELDIVLTDFAVGVLLKQKYMKYHQKEQLNLDSSPAILLRDGSPADQFSTTDMPPWMNLNLARRYFCVIQRAFPLRWNRFQNEILTLENTWNCLMKRYPETRKDDSQGNVTSNHFNDGNSFRDFVQVLFQEKMYFIPFCVIVDANTSSIVIIIGGVMSASDMLIDAITGLPSISEEESLHNICCHIGMLKAAKRIKDKLHRNGILEAAMCGRPEYQLMTTGHNLGASVAAALTLLLRPSNPSVRCFAFEPVPCVYSESLETTFDTVFSVVFNNAVIPYLSCRDVECMTKQIVKSAGECNFPKYMVFFRPLPENDEILPLSEDEAALSSISSNTDSTPEKRVPMEVDLEESKQGKKLLIEHSTDSRLYIPGTILHIRHSNSRYRLQILTANDFHPPKILPDMVIRHSSPYIEQCLKQLHETYSLLSTNL